jgi:hypothetical protein
MKQLQCRLRRSLNKVIVGMIRLTAPEKALFLSYCLMDVTWNA